MSLELTQSAPQWGTVDFGERCLDMRTEAKASPERPAGRPWVPRFRNQDMKIALLLLLCGGVAAPVSYANTQMIKLTCNLDVTTKPPGGVPRRSHETAVVEILFDAATGFKAIRIYSVAIPVAVSNKKGGAVTSFVDTSDERRWDISNRRDRSKVASEESAAIDRTTGELIARSVTTVGDASQYVEARGTCAHYPQRNPRDKHGDRD